MLVGYGRVSSASQSLNVQLEALAAAGCGKVFSEKRSGTSVTGRDELTEALDFVREGDTLVVTRLDRLARSAADLHAIVARLSTKGGRIPLPSARRPRYGHLHGQATARGARIDRRVRDRHPQGEAA